MVGIEVMCIAWYGDEKKEVILSQVLGAGTRHWFEMTVGGKCWGKFHRPSKVWEGPAQLTTDDIQILAGLIESELERPHLHISLDACVGDESWKVYIYELREGVYEITHWWGGWERYLTKIKKIDGMWVGLIETGAWNFLTTTDLQLLGEIIEKQKAR